MHVQSGRFQPQRQPSKLHKAETLGALFRMAAFYTASQHHHITSYERPSVVARLLCVSASEARNDKDRKSPTSEELLESCNLYSWLASL